MKKTNSFALLILFVTVLLIISITFLSKQTALIKSDQHLVLGKILLIIFAISSISLYINELYLNNSTTLKQMPKKLLIFSLASLLILSIFQKQVGIYATAVFILISAIYAILNKQIYSLNKIYLVVFAYGILELVGTIGTPKGFHFPDMTYSFYLLPLAFCAFRLEKQILLQIMKFLFRVTMLFMMFSVLYWWYNMMHFEVGVVQWLTKKTLVNGIPGYEFVCSWAHYTHPSYINLVILPALISGFYIHYKNNSASGITKFELIVYCVFCVFFQLVMESRIGVVGVGVILLITALYYLHLKKWFFKIALVAILILGGISVVILENSLSGFLSDNVRKTDSALAISYIKEHPVWGGGYYQEAAVLKQQEAKMSKELTPGYWPKTYTHNQLLGTMIQFGVVGAIFLIALMVGLLWYAFRSRSYVLVMFLCLYLFFMIIEEPLYVQEGITRFMVFLTFFIHLSESEKPIKSIQLWKRFPKSKPAH